MLLSLRRVAHADDDQSVQVHNSQNLRWYADASFWQAHAADVTPFFSYVDALLPRLGQDFALDVNQMFYIVVTAPNTGFSTPTPYGPGVNVSGDSFYNVAYGITGFWAYLAVTHEFINQMTGLANGAGGWPNDFWANHRSPFPNAMDPIILAELGQSGAAAAQTARFLPGGDSSDVQVPLFTGLFNDFGGWPFLQLYFSTLRADGLAWPSLRDPPDFTAQTPFISGNPSQRLANFVVAYFNLVAKIDLRDRFDSAGIGTQPPSWPGGTTFTPYSLDGNAMASIALAHCRLSVAQGPADNTATARAAMAVGDYEGVLRELAAADPCPDTCTDLCSCQGIDGCVPTYLVTTAPQGEAGTPTTMGPDSPTSAPADAPAQGGHTTSVDAWGGGCVAGVPRWPAAVAALVVVRLVARRHGGKRLRRARWRAIGPTGESWGCAPRPRPSARHRTPTCRPR